MAKKIISMLLVLLMLSSLLLACGKDDPAPTPSDSTGGDAQSNDAGGQQGGSDQQDPGETESTEPAETVTTTLGDGYVDENILKKLPTADYNGKVFNIALPNENEHGYQFDAPRITGNLEIDALYRWKKKVQDEYNMSINYRDAWDGDYFNSAGAEIAVGSSTYHLYGHYAFQIWQFIIAGYFQDLNAIGQLADENGTKYLDLSQIRWDQKLNGEVTYNGKLLSLTGDLGVSKLQSAMATFVNSNLLMDYCGMTNEDLYDIVNEGKWTFEEFKRLSAMIYEDDSQPGKSFGDTLGYLSTSGNSLDIWFPAFSLEVTRRDEVNNTITATFMDNFNVSVIDELRKFYYDSENVLMGFNVGGAQNEIAKFRNEELGFCTTQFRNVYGANGFNNMQAFGIVPTPKWDDSLDSVYRTKLNDRYTIWGVATCLLDSEKQFTAHITDALCAESSETLYYQYYEVLLKNRYSKEPATAKMVDKVMEHPHFDTVIQFGNYLGTTENNYAYLPRNLVVNRNWDISTKYGEIDDVLEGQLQTVYDCYK